MSLGNLDQSFLRGVAEGLFGSEYLRDYTHASKTFRSNNYQYTPKLKFLFHTYFKINTLAYGRNVSTGDNFGLLVKEVKLPSFSFDTTQLNQYNRKRIIQTKIKYDPITIAFHDDNGNLMKNLWQAYYNYYYTDGTIPKVVFAGARGGLPETQADAGGQITTASLANYNERNLYNESITGNSDWGYNTAAAVQSQTGTDVKPAFFENITVFGFNQHNFTAYTLINPIITQFNHDTYNYNEGSGIMQNTMTIDYETVVYNEGALDGQSPSNIVTGFGLETNYDRRLSPIAMPGSNRTILGQGGLVDGVGGTLKNLASGNLVAAGLLAGITYNTFKNQNLNQIYKEETKQFLLQATNPNTPVNRNPQFTFPIKQATPGPLGLAGGVTVGAQQNPANIQRNPTAGTQINTTVNGRILRGDSATGIGSGA